MTHDFSQRAANGTSFDVRWSPVAQAVPENKVFLSESSRITNNTHKNERQIQVVSYPFRSRPCGKRPHFHEDV